MTPCYIYHSNFIAQDSLNPFLDFEKSDFLILIVNTNCIVIIFELLIIIIRILLSLIRNQKNSRIINWICHGQGSELPGSGLFESPEMAGPEIDALLKLQLPVDDDDVEPDRSVTD